MQVKRPLGVLASSNNTNQTVHNGQQYKQKCSTKNTWLMVIQKIDQNEQNLNE